MRDIEDKMERLDRLSQSMEGFMDFIKSTTKQTHSMSDSDGSDTDVPNSEEQNTPF